MQNASDNAIVATTVGESIEAAEPENDPDSSNDGTDTVTTKQEKNRTAKAVNGQDTADDNSEPVSGVIMTEEITERLSELEKENEDLHTTVRNLIVGMSALGDGALGELLFILRKLRIIRKKPR